MQITVNLPEELAALARQRGKDPAQFVQEIFAERLKTVAHTPPRTPEEIRAWLEEVTQFSDKLPPLSGEITREWIYQDHD